MGVDVDESGHVVDSSGTSFCRGTYSAETNPRIRSTACSRLSSDEAYEIRR
jgi:hypothetical protein